MPEAKISLPLYASKLLTAVDFKIEFFFQVLGIEPLPRLLIYSSKLLEAADLEINFFLNTRTWRQAATASLDIKSFIVKKKKNR